MSVRVGVFDGTFGVGVRVFVGGTVLVRVGDGTVAVRVGVFVRVGDGTVAVRVGVLDGVRVMVGVRVIVGVRVMVGVRVGVRVFVAVLVGVLVDTMVLMLFVQVPVPPRSNVKVAPYVPVKFLLLKSANQFAELVPVRPIAGEAVLLTGVDQLLAVA